MFALVTETNGVQRVFEFEHPHLTIGRDRASGFVLDHPTVSRQHAIIAWDERGYFKLVILSRGGLTAIDGHQVAGEVALYDGSHLMFGQLAFSFHSPHAAPKPPSAYPGHTGAHAAIAQPLGAGDAMHVTDDGMFRADGQLPSPDATVDFQTFALSGQFPSIAEHEKLARKMAGTDEGLQSWDDIAEIAEEQPQDALAVFEQMQKEQQKQTGSRRPMLFIIASLLVGAVALFAIYGNTDAILPAPETEEAVDPVELATPIILWRPNDIDCHGVAGCQSAASDAYKVGKVHFERRESDITNLYESYKQLSLAEKYIEKSGVDAPAELHDLTALREEIGSAMETHFMQLRANFLGDQDRSDYQKMADTLHRIHAYYPDDRLNFHRWSTRRAAEMKSKDVYPRAQRSGE